MTDDSAASGRRSRLRRRQGVGRTGARFPPLIDAAPPPEDVVPDEPELPEGTAADPLVGRTGARFDSRARRERRDRVAAPPALPPGPSATTPSIPAPRGLPDSRPAPDLVDALLGRTGARFDSRARRARREAERQAAEDAVVPAQAAPVVRRGEVARVDRGRPGATPWADDAPTAPLHLAELRNRVEGIEPRVSVRPYVRTRGRTHARPDLRVETLVSIPSPRPSIEDPEHRVIRDLCDEPRSVAEVAALMRVPLGVARVLIGDMADDGTLTVHRTLDRLGPGSGPDRAVMARVLRGLRGL